MSYYIELLEPVTKEVVEVPPHIMHGCLVRAKMVDGMLVPTETTEASLDITYNYAKWYYTAFDKGIEYYDNIRDMSYAYECSCKGNNRKGYGIRSIYGMSGADSIKELEYVIEKIKDRNWHQELDITEKDLVNEYKELEKDWNLKSKENRDTLVKYGFGPPEKRDIDSYWVETREHALRPLCQLKALAELRPDGIWSGD